MAADVILGPFGVKGNFRAVENTTASIHAVEEPGRMLSAGIAFEPVEFMHQTLGADPTERVVGEVEPAGAVGDDHGILKETVVVDAPPKGAPALAILAGSGVSLELADTELVEML